jgi:hypothetical protein
MIEQDKPAFAELLTSVLGFYASVPSPFAIGVWWQAMLPFELDAVRRAFTAHATDPERGQFAPKPADLVRQLAGTRTDRAVGAWQKTLAAAGQVGAYSDVVFDDALIHACVADLGGWPKLCRTPSDELGFVHHRFLEAYKAYAQHAPADYPAKLLGDRSSDELYAKRGLPPPQPVLIGNVTKALRVLEQGRLSRHDFAPMAVLRCLPDVAPLSSAA